MSQFFFVVALVAALFGIACDRGQSSTTSTTASTQTSAIGPAIYALGLSFVGPDGSSVSLDAFRGHPVIVSMFYASCPSACPLTMSRIQSIERALPNAERQNLRVLLVSFDPERDTPDVLRKTAESHGVDSRWLLTSAKNDDDARTLAAALGVTYAKLPNGQFSHSSVLVLLDEEGRPLVRVEGVTSDVAPIVDSLTKNHRS